MPFTTIRSTLLALIGSLGVLILVLVTLQLSNLVTLHGEAKQQLQTNIARNLVARASLSLARERDATFLALAVGRAPRLEAAPETDRHLKAHLEALEQTVAPSGKVYGTVAALLSLELPELRQAAAAALTLPLGSQARQEAALSWFDNVSSRVAELRMVRLRLLNESGVGREVFGLHYLRTQILMLLDELLRNAALLEVEVEAPVPLFEPNSSLRLMSPLLAKAASELEVSIGPFEELLSSLGNQGIGPGETAFDAALYADAEQALRLSLQNGNGVDEALAHWRRVSSAAILQLDELQAATFRIVQDRAAAVVSDTLLAILLWLLFLCASVAIASVALRVVFAWVVAPLERMRTAMLLLAEDNLNISLPERSPLKEIGAMDDALRVFKANAIRRTALQRERHKLHGRLEKTYEHLKSDLEAAAKIQASLLPQQAQMAGVSLSSYFRPSHFLAGDTFDLLQQPDGSVIVFQIDVAGHGAAAALVSVASKYTVAQAILQRQPGSNLADLAKEINREWPSDLPYFTLVLAEIDQTSGEGTLVQAGHPSPLLLRSDGEIIVLGDGGLPIGVLAQATFDAVSFNFGPNDRLMIATDGFHEMENRDGEAFSEERVQNLLRGAAARSTEQIIADLDSAMRSWRGDDTLDDDVTIVVLEGKRANEHHRGTVARFADLETATSTSRRQHGPRAA